MRAETRSHRERNGAIAIILFGFALIVYLGFVSLATVTMIFWEAVGAAFAAYGIITLARLAS